jgi:hypothetical protein
MVVEYIGKRLQRRKLEPKTNSYNIHCRLVNGKSRKTVAWKTPISGEKSGISTPSI